ncbi:MAG: hypothetical protein QF485_07965 [Arenicellales bacterium]|jgi:hypothetical protein|nr:hypothetical protein [Arenicellales bacterium]
MILAAANGWSQEKEESAAALYGSMQGLKEMRDQMLKSLAELKAASKAVSQEELQAMRAAEEDITGALNWTVTELDNLERRYREALDSAPATPAAKD